MIGERRVLPRDELHVWVAVANDLAASGASEEMLDGEERERAQRFRFAADRRRFVVAHGLARRVLASYLGTSARRLRFARAAHGKPYLADVPENVLGFNLSHSGELVLLAVRRGSVGVDVQRTIAGVDCAAWARVEAQLKAAGGGLLGAMPANAAIAVRDLDVGPGYAAAVAAEGGAWQLRRFEGAPAAT